jgi:outer membrane protein OmpA-like peptidoglycan-associated protein
LGDSGGSASFMMAGRSITIIPTLGSRSADAKADPGTGWRITMTRCHGRMSSVLIAGFIGLLAFGNSAYSQLVSREQIVEALTEQPRTLGIADKLRLTRSLTFDSRDDVATSAQPMPAIDLQEVYFEYNSAAIRADALSQLRELGAALSDPRLKGATISIGGHTDGVGSYAFNQKLSARRAATIKQYVVENFKLPHTTLRAVGYGKQRPKNKADVFAAENRRVEIINETLGVQAQR